ncbi:MAG TPA: hypothetical protein VFE32_05965 [Puia sp.]|jgi:hypothetical protein|nr:hypothetical protein [Puia sp.]
MTHKKWTKEGIIKKYKSLYNKWRKIPTIKDLREKDYRELEYAIYRKFRKLSNLRIAANLQGDRNPPKYWTIIKIKDELKKFCNSPGSLLLKMWKHRLYHAICEKGGFNKFNADLKLGLKLNKNDWDEKAKISELKRLNNLMNHQHCKSYSK